MVAQTLIAARVPDRHDKESLRISCRCLLWRKDSHSLCIGAPASGVVVAKCQRSFTRPSKGTGKFQRYIALEPEPLNFAKLSSAAQQFGGRVQVYPYAVGSRREELRFTSAGEGSGVSANGELAIQCVPLDEVLAEEKPTFLKMDIEGAELDALMGARESIRRCRPKLAICVYHRPDHLWQVPLTVHKMLPNSRMTMRTYLHDGFETVCYCVPE